MSYVRFNQDDSDVYVFGSGTALECILAWKKADELGLKQYTIFWYQSENDPAEDYSAHKMMIGHLMWLKNKHGVVVPDYVIDRLLREIDQS